MPYERPKQFKVEVTKEDKKCLVKLSQRYKIKQKVLMGYLIEICDKYDLVKGDWRARLEDQDKERVDYTKLDGTCAALGYADDNYICVWGRDGKPPEIKKLAKDLDEALDLCSRCEKTLLIKGDLETAQAKIRDLEIKLHAKATEVWKVPHCTRGCMLNEDATEFMNCPKNYGRAVSVTGYCKLVNDNRGCNFFKELVIGAETKITNLP